MATAVFTFGRMNPPTIGHEKLVNKVKSTARTSKATPLVYLSQTQNPKKDPLSYNDKIKFATTAFGNLVKKSSARTVIEVLKELEKKYDYVIMVAGSDRVQEFDTLLQKYNGKDYKFNNIQVISAGERDPDAEGAAGMSATKMRDAAADNNMATFKIGLPKGLKASAQDVFKKVRDGMNIKESLDELYGTQPKITGRAFTYEPTITEKDLDKIDADKIDDKDLEKLAMRMDDEDLEDLGIDMAKFINDMDDDEEMNEELLMQLDEFRVLDITQRRALARRMRRFAPRLARLRKIRMKRKAPEKRLIFRARKKAVEFIRKRVAGAKGLAYKTLPTTAKISIDKLVKKKAGLIHKIAKRLMPKVRKAELVRLQKARKSTNEEVKRTTQDKDIADKKGTQPAKYHKGLKPSTKSARDSQFKKQTKMDDDNPAAYKDAPGDKAARKKPMPLSKYTKQYRKDYGEEAHGGEHQSSGRSMTDAEKKKREDIKKGLMKNKSDFKDRYGKDADSVMNALATKMAMKEAKAIPYTHAVQVKGAPKHRQFMGYFSSQDKAATYAKKTQPHVPNAKLMVVPKTGKSIRTDYFAEDYNTPAAEAKPDKTYPRFAALTDLDLNTKNRNMTIDEYSYGPANPDNERDSKMFWDNKADLWNCNVDQVKSMRCGNCSAFNQTPEVKKKMAEALGPEGKTIIEKANLGYCEFFEFKCAGSRTCDAWVGGGPITEETDMGLLENYMDQMKHRYEYFDDPEKARAFAAKVKGKVLVGTGKRGPKYSVKYPNPTFKEDVAAMRLNERKIGGYDIDDHIVVRKGNKYHKTIDNIFDKKSDAAAFAKKHDGFLIPQARGRFLVGLNKITEDIAATRDKHKRERENLKRDHDREMDSARLRAVRMKNREEEAKKGRPKKGERDGPEEIEHIQVQLRKVINLRGMRPVDFTDGKKERVSTQDAQKVLSLIDKTRNADEKLKIVRFVQQSLKNLKHVASGKPVPAKRDPFAIPMRSNYPDTARISGISGSYPRNSGKLEDYDVNQRFEFALQKAFRLDEMFEAFMDEKEIKSYKQHARSSIAPRDNYMIEKDMAGLRKKAQKTGISYSTLKKVYDRGVAAWRTGHRPGTTPSQWGYGRVNAFIAKKKKGNLDHDKDLAHYDNFQGQLVAEAYGKSNEIGTDQLRKKYQQDTPGQEGDISLAIDYIKKPEIAPTARQLKKVDEDFERYCNAIDFDNIVMDEAVSKAQQAAIAIAKKESGKYDSEGNKIKEKTYLRTHPKLKNLKLQVKRKKGKIIYPGKKDEEIQNEDHCGCNPEAIMEAEYQGKKVKLNDPIRTSENPKKKFKVYVKDPATGNIKVVRFGDPNLSIKRDDPARRKSFRARHNCDNPGPKTKPRYWSCFQWRGGSKVDN